MTGRDRLRELLDAVLDEENPRLDDMASDAFASSFHFSREVSRGTGESPVALRRRVMLERSAWRVAGGMSVTDAAWEAGYDSLEGFSRAFTKAYGAPPSAFTSRGDIRAHWLAAPNGVHFHPPLNLWVHDAEETSLMHVAAQLFQHDLDDTDHLIDVVKGIPEADFRREVLPGQTVLSWDGTEPSVADVLDGHIWSKEVWTAVFDGADFPTKGANDPVSLMARQEAIAPRWLEVVRDVERRNAWDDRLIDALCEPPESFQIGSVLAHVLTFGAHRRQLVRLMLRASGHEIDHGDPIDWLRKRNEK